MCGTRDCVGLVLLEREEKRRAGKRSEEDPGRTQSTTKHVSERKRVEV